MLDVTVISVCPVFRSVFRRLFKRNIVIEPRSRHHTRFTVLLGTDRARYHESHAVDHADPGLCSFIEGDFDRLIRHKLRLRRHNAFSVAALREFINQSLFCLVIT